MSAQTEFLAVGGPAHLAIVKMAEGVLTFSLPYSSESDNAVVQTFVYHRAGVTLSALEFLVPSHLDAGNSKAMTGWIFNQLVTALVTPHPLRSHVLLSLGFNIRDDVSKGMRVVRAMVNAHPVSVNGRVAPNPIKQNVVESLVMHEQLTAELIKALATRTMEQAVAPFIASAVDHVAKHENWKP